MDLSLIVPVYNEEHSLRLLVEGIGEALASHPISWEVVFVEDGSTDGSQAVLENLVHSDPEHLRLVAFRRNYGQTAAIAAGIDYSQGATVVLLDADLQNDPADIPRLLGKLDEGFDLVSGWRRIRKDNAFTRNLPSAIANWLISSVTGVHLHDYGCTLKAYRRDALEGFRLYGEMHRFIPVYAHSVGARIAELPVNHRPRRFGKTNYGLERTLKVVLDLLTVKFLVSYSNKPIRLFGGAGLVLIFMSALTLLYLFVRRMLEQVSVLASPLFQLGVMFFILGFQSILMGLIAELLVRTYHESQQKPTYTIRSTLNVNQKA
jgi:glycosyltransferase involved in cell wall biosynthesis